MSSIAHLFESGEQARQKGHFLNLVMLARVDGTLFQSGKSIIETSGTTSVVDR